MKNFIDHILLLFSFEKNILIMKTLVVNLLDILLCKIKKEIKLTSIKLLEKNKALISVFAGSRKSEINVLMPILLNFIKMMNEKYSDMTYVFHSTKEHSSSNANLY